MKEKKRVIFIGIILIIVISVIILSYLNNANNNSNIISESVIKCIAENSKLYLSRTCGHCANQKKILGDYLNYFNITDCVAEPEKCALAKIEYVPTWIINGKYYKETKSLEDLRKITKC